MGTLTEMLAQIEASGRKYYIYILFRPCGTPFYVGKGRGGKPLSAAHREAIGAAHRGMKRSQAFRERMREIALARPRKLGTTTLGKPATTIQFSDTAAV
jgi:hypothetical protein